MARRVWWDDDLDKWVYQDNLEPVAAGEVLVKIGTEIWTSGPPETPTSSPEQVAPDDNPKTRFGLTKPAMSVVPAPALVHLMRAMMDGARKYEPFNWRRQNVSSSIYYDAALRHLMAWFDGEEIAEDSGVHHLGHVMACCAILLDAQAQGTLNDNRPVPGRFAELVKAFTAPLSEK
jgi:hypothetical protein